jgi:hypothetical protein
MYFMHSPEGCIMHKSLKLHDYIHFLSILYSLKLVVYRPTDQLTDQPTDRPTDIATYRAAIAAKNH